MTLQALSALAAKAAAWDALTARAAAPPFFARHVLEAHRAHGLCPADLAAVVVHDATGQLEALVPIVQRPAVTALGGRVARPWLSPYMTASTPLVAAGPGLTARLDALVAGLAQAAGGRSWRWPLLPSESPVGAELLAALQRAGWQIATVSTFARPVLDRRASYAAFLAEHPHKGRFKDLRRRRRRLAEAGALTLTSATTGADLADAITEFLALEAAGWKGVAGTALGSHVHTAAFARTLFQPAPGPVTARADVLRLDGRAIAASLALVAGQTAYLLKTAYDETLRGCAPGLILEDEIIQALHATAFADRLDAATLPGSALENLYPDRETIADVVAVPLGRLLPVTGRVRLAHLEQRARAEFRRRLGRR
ncbi:GNAT family N-acetyltransferase [Methylorubrum thiocyanatum]|uniref:GNAT family N-acetyltransferase n=1 Tax=Methylorubrum thiocyanatum TaxID=47958 RepID=UPI0035C792B1